MSNKSRRRANTSPRRVSLAAGALLAGAAIPIAAAGTAWADQTSDGNNAPAIPITAAGPAPAVLPSGPSGLASPDVTPPSLSTLEGYGLNPTQAQDVLTADANQEAVQVSYNGKV